MATLDLTKREEKGSPLTIVEHDDNLTDIETQVNLNTAAIGDVSEEDDDVQTRLTAAEGDIDDLETTVGTNTEDIGTNETAIGLNTAHRGLTTGNPHAVTKSEVGLNSVTNHAQLKIATQWNADISAKATPADADLILSEDSAASYAKKKTTWTQLKVFLKTYWDTLYHPLTTVGIADNNLVEMDDEDAATTDYCKLTTNGIEGRDASQVRSDLGIETGATADQTGGEIKAAYEGEDDTNAFTDADHSKLDAIEAEADVTNETNVAGAGAVMDSDISPSEGILRKTGAGAYTAHKTNLSAVVNPTVDNDTGEGYSASSLWFNTAEDSFFICIDASEGAAVWSPGGTTGGDVYADNDMTDNCLIRGDGGAKKIQHCATLTVSDEGEMVNTGQPCFNVKPTTNQENITTGGPVTVVFGTELFDVGNNFASNIFTAPISGKYQLNFKLCLSNLDTAGGHYHAKIHTSNQTYSFLITPQFAIDPAYWTLLFSSLANMDLNDTAYCSIEQWTGDVQTGILSTHTDFTGVLIC